MKQSKAEIIENINQAFLQLMFSIKLLNYFNTHGIDKDQFDCTSIWYGKYINLSIPHNIFNTYNDLILSSENTYNITLGFTSIILNDVLESIFPKRDPSDNTPDGMLQTLVYMIRCAYAHNMMYPKWEVRGKYARHVKIIFQHKCLDLDLPNKDGMDFRIDDIGGLQNYLEIKEKVIQLISNN